MTEPIELEGRPLTPEEAMVLILELMREFGVDLEGLCQDDTTSS